MNQINPRRVAVVTGGTGCLGYHLIRQLMEAGSWEITALHRASSNTEMLSELPGIRLVPVDFLDQRSLQNAIPKGADAVFHVAANVSHHPDPEQFPFNVTGTKHLAEAAFRAGVGRFIFTSTGATRYARDVEDPTEIRRLLGSEYALSKRLAELAVWKVAALGLDTVILQPIIVLGTNDWHGNYSQLFDPKLFLKRLRAALPGSLTFCDAEMIAQAHVAAYESGRSNQVYVLGGAYLRWKELFKVIAEVTGCQPPLITLPTWWLMLVGYIELGLYRTIGRIPLLTPDLVRLLAHEDPVQFPDHDRAYRDLGYDPDTLDVFELCERVSGWMALQRH